MQRNMEIVWASRAQLLQNGYIISVLFASTLKRFPFAEAKYEKKK